MTDKTWGEKFPQVQDDGDLKVHVNNTAVPISGTVTATVADGLIVTTYPADDTPYLIEDVGSRGHMMTTITWEHWLVHRGYMWSGMHLKTGIADDGKYQLHFKTGPDKRVHLAVELTASTAAWVTVYSDATMSSDGTVIEYGPNRLGSSTDLKPELDVYHTPTVSANGTKMGDLLLGGGNKQNPVAGGSRAGGAEWELDKNKSYLLLIEAKGGAGVTTDFGVEFNAYKEPN